MCWIEAVLFSAMDGVKIGFYLVHSMGSAGSFEENDRIAAQNFGEIAKAAGVEHIIYLGGLGNEKESLILSSSQSPGSGKCFKSFKGPGY